MSRKWTPEQQHAIALLDSMTATCNDPENDLDELTAHTRGVKIRATKTTGFIRVDGKWRELSKAEAIT